MTRSDLRSRTSVPNQTFGGYWNGDRIPQGELLFDIADHLDTTARWLVTGVAPRRSALVAADDADWVMLSEYDLREIGDDGKGEPRLPSPFRRDWLNQTLGVSAGLWLTRMPFDYVAAGLGEGALVFCADVDTAGLLEGHLCLFRINGGLVTAKFTYRPESAIAAATSPDAYVRPTDIGHEENQYVPIARILGRLIGRL